MAGPFDLTGQNIENTYQRVLQTPDGVTFYDGTGSLINLPGGVTVPGNPNKSIQFNGNGGFSGSSNFIFDSASNSMILTGSMITTGSNLLIGATTLTGSLNITGSTTQTGNNTLIGNTLLTGSIIISGSNPPGSTVPSVKIWGDTQHNGYIRFDPVSTNIDTSISASYIYVSGSTNDLYFSQNGAGYNNVTRLRWLEGNLYTGLLHGGAVTQVNSNTYQVASGSGIIVNLNASIPNDPYPVVQYLNWGNLTKTIDALSASYDQQFIAISSSNQIHAEGTPYFNGEVDTYIPIGIVLHQNRSSINGVKTQPSLAYGWKQRSNVFISAFGPLKLSGHALATSSSRGLTVGSGTSFADGANYPTDPNNPSYVTDPGTNVSKIFRYRQSGSNWVYDTNGGVGYTVIDPTQYSLNGTLTGVANNSWSIQRVYWFPNSVSKAIVVYYGNAVYSTESEAIANINIEPFVEAPNTAANAIYVGAIIIKGDGTFTVDADFTILPGGLFRGVGGGGGGGGGTTSPGGSNTQIQYNNNNAFGGVPVLTYNGTTLSATGSFTGSFTGSLLGTASYATTASYALNGGVTRLLAGPNITLSPTNGLGQVTITSTGGGGVYGNTATGSYGSFYDTTTQTNPVINVLHSMSINTTDISNGVSISGSTNPYNTYIKTENIGVYDIQFSAQLEKTSTGNTSIAYIWLRKNGVDLAETNTIVELSQNGKGVAAWNWFVNSAANDYYQIMWAANRTDIQLSATTPALGPAVPSLIVTVNRVDQFLSNTGSFTGSFTGIFTGSLLGTAATASYYQETDPIFTAKSASLATTGSNTFRGTQTVSGSLFVKNGSNNVLIADTINGNYQLNDGSGVLSVDWNNRTLSNGNRTPVDWFNRYLRSSNNNELSIDWENRQLYANDGTTSHLDWSDPLHMNLPSITESPIVSVLGIDSSGNIYSTASSAIGGGGTGGDFVPSSWTGSAASQFAGTASRATTASLALTASFLPIGTYQITSSWATNALTASRLNADSTSIFGDSNRMTITASNGIIINAGIPGISLESKTTVIGDLLPGAPFTNNTSSYSLGSSTQAWKDLYVSNGSVYFISGSNSASISFTNGNIDFGGANLIIPTGSIITSASYAQTSSILVDQTTVGTNIVTQPNPSAIRYLRINADNSVSQLTSAQLQTDLGVPVTIVKANNQTTQASSTAFEDITGLSFNAAAGVLYEVKMVCLYNVTNTATGNRWAISSSVAADVITYHTRTIPATGVNGYASGVSSATTYDGTTTTGTSAYTANGLMILEGFIQLSSNGTVTGRFATEVTVTSTSCRSGSFIQYRQIS